MFRSTTLLGLLACSFAAPAALALALDDEPLAAFSAVDAAPPTFSASTEISNPLQPFTPGSAKVFRGRGEGARTTVIESHLVETRDFSWNGQTITTRVLEEKEFAQGVLVEIARNYLAQADDGSVWAFGEVSVEFEDGVDVGAEDDAWLVSGPTEPGDHLNIQNVDGPSMFMPAELVVGQVFSRENFPGGSELVEVVATDVKFRTPAGKFVHAVRLFETGSSDEPPTHSWVAPGVGVIGEKSKQSRNKLIATSLLEHADELAGG